MKAVSLTWIAILCFVTGHMSPQPNDSTTKDESRPNPYTQTSPASQNNGKPADYKKAAESNSPRWYTSSEWWLVIIAAVTGAAIAYQAREMKRATNVMKGQLEDLEKQTTLLGEYVSATKDGVDATRKAAEAASDSVKIQAQTVILQYRPKIIVRFARALDFNVAELGQPAKGKVRFKIINIGGSPAHVIGGNAALWSAEGPRSIHSNRVEISQGTETPMKEFTLQPGEDRGWEDTLNASVTNDIQWANYHQGVGTEPSKAIFLVGTIWYRDDLNIPRQTGIYRKYDPKTGWFVPQDSEGEYTD